MSRRGGRPDRRLCINGATHQLREDRALPGRGAPARLQLVRKADQRVLAELQIAGPARMRTLLLEAAPASAAELARELPPLLRRWSRRGGLRRVVAVLADSGARVARRRQATAATASQLPRALVRALARSRRRERARGDPAELEIPADYGTRHGLAPQREPGALIFAGFDVQGRELWLLAAAAVAWRRMLEAAAGVDIVLQPVSGFRSAAYQASIVRRKLARGQAMERILEVSAAPGYSEHHSGRAIDITTPDSATLEEEFESSAAFAWLQRHAGSFGFRLSYPRGNAHGMVYEPWHWYYAGGDTGA